MRKTSRSLDPFFFQNMCALSNIDPAPGRGKVEWKSWSGNGKPPVCEGSWSSHGPFSTCMLGQSVALAHFRVRDLLFTYIYASA